MTIELEGKYQRGRGSVDEYLEQTAIANPHVTLHYKDPEGNVHTYRRSTRDLPAEPKEIKPHPYGVELGRLVTMLKDTKRADDLAVPDHFLLACQSVRRSAHLRSRQSQHASVRLAGLVARKRIRCTTRFRRRRSRHRPRIASARSAKICC